MVDLTTLILLHALLYYLIILCLPCFWYNTSPINIYIVITQTPYSCAENSIKFIDTSFFDKRNLIQVKGKNIVIYKYIQYISHIITYYMEQVASSKIARCDFDMVRVFCDDRRHYENCQCPLNESKYRIYLEE